MDETLFIEIDRITSERYAQELTKLEQELTSHQTKQRVNVLSAENAMHSTFQFRLHSKGQVAFKFTAVLIEATDFFELISGSRTDDAEEGTLLACRTLEDCSAFLKHRFGDGRICLVVNGPRSLIKRIEQNKKRRFRNVAMELEEANRATTSNAKSSAPKKKRARNDPLSDADAQFVEGAIRNGLVELQIAHDIDSLCVETANELFAFVQQSAASAMQFSQKKNRLDDELTVVEKRGDSRTNASTLRSQLSLFPSVSSDVADAILTQYSSVKALRSALCSVSAERRVDVLANVAIRRGFGVLSTERRVGPQTARRITEFLTVTDPDHVLK